MGAARPSDRGRVPLSGPDLGVATVARLRSIHAVKAGALAMFDSMLAEVAAQRDDQGTPAEVAELLGRMFRAFSGHRTETARHVQLLEARLIDLGRAPAARRAGSFAWGARAWAAAGRIGGQNHGANARNAFVFEHYEIAALKLLEQLAERGGDGSTLALVRDCLADDEEMAATIGRNWTNVLTLTLAS